MFFAAISSRKETTATCKCNEIWFIWKTWLPDWSLVKRKKGKNLVEHFQSSTGWEELMAKTCDPWRLCEAIPQTPPSPNADASNRRRISSLIWQRGAKIFLKTNNFRHVCVEIQTPEYILVCEHMKDLKRSVGLRLNSSTLKLQKFPQVEQTLLLECTQDPDIPQGEASFWFI